MSAKKTGRGGRGGNPGRRNPPRKSTAGRDAARPGSARQGSPQQGATGSGPRRPAGRDSGDEPRKATVPAARKRRPDTARTPAAPDPQPRRRPLTVTVAAVVAALEGVALAGLALFMMVEGAIGKADDLKAALAGGVALLALAAMPLAAARGLHLVRSWSRGPVLVIQIIALPVAWTMVQNGGAMVAVGAAVAVCGLAGAVALIHPATTEALQRTPQAAD